MGQPDATIRIQGQGSAPAVPDGIRFRLTLSATRPRPDEALHDVTTRSERLDALLTELGISDDARSTSGLSIREQREWVTETTGGAHRERSVHRGFEAQNSILVRIDDPTISGRLIQGAVEEADALVDGPWWHVAAETRAISRRAPKRLGTPVDERRRTRRRWGFDWERYGRSGTPSRPRGNNPGGCWQPLDRRRPRASGSTPTWS
jgi:Protein of unknown function (DUF541)